MARLRIEGAGGLVREQHHRPVRERPRDRHALPLTAGQRRRKLLRLFGNPDPLEELRRAAPPLLARDARVEHRELDVAQDRRLRKEVVELEHEPDLLISDPGELRTGEAVHALSVERVRAVRRRVEATQDRHERRLARARRPDQGEELAGLHGQVDPAQRPHRDAVAAERLRQGLRFDDRFHRASCSRRPSRPSSSSDLRARPGRPTAARRGSRRVRAWRRRP